MTNKIIINLDILTFEMLTSLLKAIPKDAPRYYITTHLEKEKEGLAEIIGLKDESNFTLLCRDVYCEDQPENIAQESLFFSTLVCLRGVDKVFDNLPLAVKQFKYFLDKGYIVL